MESERSNSFARLGKVITKRKYLIILAWLVILALVLPFVLDLSGVVSLQLGSASDAQLESVRASNVISLQFSSTVHSNSLIIVVSTSNASSIQTQEFIDKVVTEVESNSSISGLQSVTSIYSILVPTLNQTNQGTYALFDNSNMTSYLLYGVPAQYLNAWSSAFNQTQNVTLSNQIAYNQTAYFLNQTDPITFQLYSSHVLDLFNASWTQSYPDLQMQNYTLIEIASAACNNSSQMYVYQYMNGQQDFGLALIESFSLQDFMTDSPQQNAQKLQNFAVEYISNSSGLSVDLVNSTFTLGRNPGQMGLETLTGNIILDPTGYTVGPELEALISSFVSPAKNVTLISISTNKSSDQNLRIIRDIIRSDMANNPANVSSALVTSGDAIESDFSQSTQQDLAIILPITLILLIVATGLFFRSVVTPLITLGTIGVGLGISQIFIVLVGTFINKVDFMIPTILLTVLIGVGTDYSIFIIARHREERVRGLSTGEAIIKSVTWAGESIATSGATVIISFLALSSTTIVLLQTLGIIVGSGVIISLLIALTLVPAIVSLLGERVFWPNSGRRFQKYSESSNAKSKRKTGYFARSGAFSVRRAKFLILLAVIVTAPTLYIYLTTVPSYDFLGGAPNSLESISASKTLSSSFGGGTLFPSYVVITFSQPLISDNALNSTEMNTVQAISSYLAGHQDVQEVTGPTMPYGSPIPYSNLAATPEGNMLLSAILQNIGADNKTALLTLKFQVDPYSTQAIDDAQDMRTTLHRDYDGLNGVTGIYVGGATGSILDTKGLFLGEFNIVLPVVALGVAIVLFIVLGSLILPIFAVVSVLMSIVWTLAVTKLVFQSAFNYGLLFITPLFLFTTLLGLGMDYNIFILTRIREEATKGEKLDDAITLAIEKTGGIITAAAVILAGSLGALMLSTDVLLKEIGFAFSFSILIDALVVRTYLVPAVMSTLGKWNWYNPIPYFRRSRNLYEKEEHDKPTAH